MKLNKLFFSLSLLFLATSVFAQESREDVVFRAMRDEAARTKTMKMQQMPAPFFLTYYIEDTKSLSIRSQYGSVVDINRNNGTANVGAEIFVGDEAYNNRLDYSGKLGAGPGTTDNNYLSLRTTLWNLSDIIYKNSLKELQVKSSAMQQMTLAPDEKDLKDLIKSPVVQNMDKRVCPTQFDEQKWSTICNHLSELFKKYNDLTETSISYKATDKQSYICNSDGLELKQNTYYVNIYATASIQNENGVEMKNDLSIFASEDGELPTEAELVKKVEEFATKMSSLKSLESISEYYNGPVMFTEGAATTLFMSNLTDCLTATKGLTKNGWLFNSVERRMGRKVIDTRISVKNYTSLKEYKGKKLLGYYEIDADGVTPAKEMALIENGLLKQMLSGNSETLVNKKPTGSARMAIGAKGMFKTIAPGTLHISVDKGMKESAMKKTLIKLAKEEGLNYAYIVNSLSATCPEVYQIDVKSGEMKRVGSTKISKIDLSSLRRMAGISSEENVINTNYNGVLTSIIVPKSVILNDIEIDINKLNKTAQPLLPSPLKR